MIQEALVCGKIYVGKTKHQGAIQAFELIRFNLQEAGLED